MELDFRNGEDAQPQLAALDATTMNSLVDHCKKNVISIASVTVIHFGESEADLINKVGWATGIAKHFDAVVHFQHRDVPITAYPDTRTATFADYERRKGAGELVGNLAETCGLCGKTRKWHEKNRPRHMFRLEEDE